MIHAIRCDQAGFKDVEFQPGLNVILAVRTNEATVKDSRNGLGKTTVVEIIHFCLGSKADKENRLTAQQLQDWTFSLDIDLRGRRYVIHRNTKNHKRVLLEGDFSDWPVKPKLHSDSGYMAMSISDWNEILGWLMFDLSPEIRDSKYAPSFRSLVSFFVRRGLAVFGSPFENYQRQLSWDVQVNNGFLLGLAWEHASRAQQLKDRESTLDQLKKATKTGVLPQLLGTIGQLEVVKVRLEEKIARIVEQLRTFKVHPQYQDIQERADFLQAEIRALNLESVTDQSMLTFYQESLKEEHPAEQAKLSRVYAEAGVTLPDRVLRRLQDVQEFHSRVVSNRRSFLQVEIGRLLANISVRSERVRSRTDDRASVLLVLQTHGALAEYSQLQRLNTEDQASLQQVRQKIETIKKLEQGKAAVRIEKDQLQLIAQSDYDERQKTRERAISLFNSFSEALYARPGKLVIDVTKQGGFKFEVEIERKDSHGVEQMKVFCYDLTLAKLWASRQVNPGFLVHDSGLFADVDERQKAHALELAATVSKESGFQYICCLNSDSIPRSDFRPEFDFDQFVRLKLTDATDSGGLLGIRF